MRRAIESRRVMLAGVLFAHLAIGVGRVCEAADPSTHPVPSQPAPFTGSSSCRECHERFYELWVPSHHGLAMQPYTAELARTRLGAQKDEIVIGEYRYRADVERATGCVRERGPEGEKTYPIAHVLGGKNVYYFLTPMTRGRLQVLPVAYDVRRKTWFDTTASAVRHFTDRTDEALNWRERPLTFNTSCHGCHVSQLSTNYDLKTDTYRTAWAEPGINCETCHGGGAEHVRVCKAAGDGPPPKDLKIIRTEPFTVDQTNAMCAPCHAKMIPLTASFTPGDRYFDHYDLVTFENPDFHPDGRDLGENYTYTLWRTSPCVESGQLDCSHCHTSSGRYRFSGERTNHACLPCHRERVENVTTHSHHDADGEGARCVACHMPMTEFARMRRSDHSMRPPTPAATIRYKSPNACNLCHTDKDAAWSDGWVRKWHRRDYQAPVLRRADLVAAARKRDWSVLSAMLGAITDGDRDEVVATSLIRLLRVCDDGAKWPAMLKAMKDSSPLVRGAAAEVLGEHLTPEVARTLIRATRDEYRIVRVRSAGALAGYPRDGLAREDRDALDRASAEFEASMQARPDDSASHYNLGNYYMSRNQLEQALTSFATATRLAPDFIAPLVNASLAHNLVGRNAEAEASLRKALKVDPGSAAANLNLALLLGEQGRLREAESAFRAAFKADPKCAVAAYNLAVILSGDRIDQAVEWCRKAYELCPDDAKYGYTLAYFQRQRGDADGAVRTLRQMVERQTTHVGAYALLGQIHEEQGRRDEAIAVYRRAVANDKLPERERVAFAARVRALSSQ